jgi:hypothetical protein
MAEETRDCWLRVVFRKRRLQLLQQRFAEETILATVTINSKSGMAISQNFFNSISGGRCRYFRGYRRCVYDVMQFALLGLERSRMRFCITSCVRTSDIIICRLYTGIMCQKKYPKIPFSRIRIAHPKSNECTSISGRLELKFIRFVCLNRCRDFCCRFLMVLLVVVSVGSYKVVSYIR